MIFEIRSRVDHAQNFDQSFYPVERAKLRAQRRENGQTDLPRGQRSGLRDALDLLEGIRGIGMVRFTDVDVVRHPLVATIIRAYDARDRARSEAREAQAAPAPQGSAGTPQVDE